MDKSCHLSDFTSTTDSFYKLSTQSAPDDNLLQLDSTSTSFQQQDISSVEIEFVPRFKGHLDQAHLSQTDGFLEHHDYELFLLNKRLIHHLTISAIRTVIIETSYAKMTPSSLMHKQLFDFCSTPFHDTTQL